MREVPDFLSWLQYFRVYVGIVANQKPEMLHQLMAYQTLMIQEAQRCGGDRWQGYDTMFRQLAAELSTIYSDLHGPTEWKRKRKDVPLLFGDQPPELEEIVWWLPGSQQIRRLDKEASVV